jgi:LmbE family N-acetylglucosaminyl deacetylase
MLALALPPGPVRILCLGAHPDDIEIGCGGTLLELLAAHPGSSCEWVVLSGGATVREQEARDGAARFLAAAGERTVTVQRLRDGHFPVALTGLKEMLEDVRRRFTPDVVFTHYRDDRHQDHRTTSDATWQAFRDHLILEYEVPKWDGDLGRPELYVPLTKEMLNRKVEHLLASFTSQRDKPWFTAETFVGLARLRGIECRARDGYAEGFHAPKLSLLP